MTWAEWTILSMVCFGVGGAGLGWRRGRPVAGLFLGAFLGPWGLILAALLDRSEDAEVRSIRRRMALEERARFEQEVEADERRGRVRHAP